MTREALFKKWYKNKEHDYEISETLAVTDDTGRNADICFIYSGRNRGKSFEIATQLIADAYYDGKTFGYIRRNEAKTFEIELYFADKEDFIADMTDGQSEGITRDKGKLYLYHIEEKGDKLVKVLDKEIGYAFALSTQGKYKSLQFPKMYNLIYEEVLTESNYLSAEPEKLMNLYSTVRRSKENCRMWLVSNTISVVNPYSKAWGIFLSQNKPGEIRLSKLYLGSYDESKKEQYYLIACHYLKDKNDLTKEDAKKKRNRVKTSVASNKWDELNLYTTMDLSFVNQYAEKMETVIFEYDDLMMQGDILEIPSNLMELYLMDENDKEYWKKSQNTMPILYIRRKTTKPHSYTRIYTNNADRFSEYVSRGFKVIYTLDNTVNALMNRGWCIGADNLTMNDFYKMYDKLLYV